MDPIVFNVKDKSIHHFFAEHLISADTDRQGIRSSDLNPYYFMKDEIYLKRTAGIAAGSNVVFELQDRAAGSGKALVNTYVYESEQYDDVGIRLKLIDFKVNIAEPKK